MSNVQGRGLLQRRIKDVIDVASAHFQQSNRKETIFILIQMWPLRAHIQLYEYKLYKQHMEILQDHHFYHPIFYLMFDGYYSQSTGPLVKGLPEFGTYLVVTVVILDGPNMLTSTL